MQITLVTILVTAAISFPPPPDLPPVITKFVGKVQTYYRDPDPKLAEELFAAMLDAENLDHKWFDKKEDVLDTIGTQLGDLTIGKDELIRPYEAAFPTTTLRGKRLIIAALKVCGDKKSEASVESWLKDGPDEELRDELEALLKHLKDPKRKHYRDLPVTTPHGVDLLWANFYLTGEYEPASRILDIFDGPDDKEHETLRRVARFSLVSNLQQHPKLVQLIQKHRKERGAGSEKVLSEIIVEFKGSAEK